MIGQTLGHYRIVEKIGAGGMGEVYRARDEHLGRDVAIKVLPAGTLADDSARRRFRAEAEALARLNHPHIATVHDFATQDGTDFLVMEFVPGSSLADRLAEGSLPEKEVLRLGMQVAAALEEAHQNRIVHRDLKPANIRLTAKGDAKVLDFGLAKLLRPVDEINTQSLTQSQAVVGTLPYMAPEQLRAEAVDARTDIYAFGCVLYEMATGQRPFRETVSATLTDAILNRPAPSPRQLSAQLSGELERIILKCLEKDPDNRYQSAKEIGVDLRRLATPTAISTTVQPSGVRRWVPLPRRYAIAAGGLAALVVALLLGFNLGGLRDRLLGKPAGPKIESLAVLPLENLSGDPEQDYFADGMTEELTMNLAKIGALRVTSRTSVLRYKKEKKPVPIIARELGVDAVIEGSVRRMGDRVRITVQLIHAGTDAHLWAESYERDVRDVLALQNEVAQAIAKEIRVKLAPQEEAWLAATHAVKPEAHEAYLRGVYAWNEGSLGEAIQYFEQAIELDPNYAPPYAGVARAYYFIGLFGVEPPRQAFSRMKERAQKALELDPTLADAHGWLALVKLHYDWDWRGAEQEFRRALELNPSQADIRHDYAHYLMVMNRPDEWVTESKRAVELNPFDSGLAACLAWHHLHARQFDQARDQALRSLQLEGDAWWGHMNLGFAYEQKGMFEEAIAEFQTAAAAWANGYALASLGHAYAVSGRKQKAQQISAQLTEQSKRGYVSAYDMAVLHAGLGEKEKAFAWLEKAYQERSAFLIHMQWDPRFDNLRDDPRFQALLRRMNFPEN